MSQVFTLRGVCVEVPKVGIKQKQVAGLTLLATKELEPMTAIFATDIIINGVTTSVAPGDKILVAAEFLTAQRWSKETYEFGGKTFVVVPYDVILGVVYPDATREFSPTPEPTTEQR